MSQTMDNGDFLTQPSVTPVSSNYASAYDRRQYRFETPNAKVKEEHKMLRSTGQRTMIKRDSFPSSLIKEDEREENADIY